VRVAPYLCNIYIYMANGSGGALSSSPLLHGGSQPSERGSKNGPRAHMGPTWDHGPVGMGRWVQGPNHPPQPSPPSTLHPRQVSAAHRATSPAGGPPYQPSPPPRAQVGAIADDQGWWPCGGGRSPHWYLVYVSPLTVIPSIADPPKSNASPT